ncbi:XRE family transcriptional regulator [Streptomyces sp. NPDC006267]|uniref:XRE family transcriptional regulator n=1 Tax=Streptomyces sp. NPDC006267 TaxID=3157173 RepID=UPI0033AF3952
MKEPDLVSHTAEVSTFAGQDAAADAIGPFAVVFRNCVQQRGLSLDRIRGRLADQGINVSLATLSYWQRGRSQPERADSLRAVDALEAILDLPSGSLRSRIGPSRSRGRITSAAPGLDASRQVFGERSHVERALGTEFAQFNSDFVALTIHETVQINSQRRCLAVTVKQVIRATQAGARHITVVHDEISAESATLIPHYGRLGTVRRLPELRVFVAEIDFGRPLARDESALIAYTLRYGPEPAERTYYERRVRTSPHEYLLHVCFQPDVLPISCHRYFREQIDTPARYERRVALDVSHTSHMLLHKCSPCVHGMSWQWSR